MSISSVSLDYQKLAVLLVVVKCKVCLQSDPVTAKLHRVASVVCGVIFTYYWFISSA